MTALLPCCRAHQSKILHSCCCAWCVTWRGTATAAATTARRLVPWLRCLRRRRCSCPATSYARTMTLRWRMTVQRLLPTWQATWTCLRRRRLAAPLQQPVAERRSCARASLQRSRECQRMVSWCGSPTATAAARQKRPVSTTCATRWCSSCGMPRPTPLSQTCVSAHSCRRRRSRWRAACGAESWLAATSAART